MDELIILFYDLGFILASLLFFVRYFFRGRINRELLKRLCLPKRLISYLEARQRPIWLHAVSVGEVASLRELIERLSNFYPQYPLVISTITPQGKELACKLYKEKAFIFYLPLDLSFIIKRVVKQINPRIFLVVETEIWPNLYYFLSKRNIPIIILNARLSERSIKFYRLAKFLLRRVFNKISFVAAQDAVSSQRFLELGLTPFRLKLTGNMKFSTKAFSEAKLSEFKNHFQKLVKEEEILFLAGSTHPPEEEIILETYKILKESYPQLRLLICPRHIERSQKISQIVERFGFKPLLLSRWAERETLELSKDEVFILDTVGELIYFYSLADIVFVGGSLAKYGGHNILEPAFFSKPIVVGKYMFNFQEIKKVFLEEGACIEVKSKKEFLSVLFKLIEDKVLREELGRRARNILDKSKDTLKENFEIIKNFLEYVN